MVNLSIEKCQPEAHTRHMKQLEAHGVVLSLLINSVVFCVYFACFAVVAFFCIVWCKNNGQLWTISSKSNIILYTESAKLLVKHEKLRQKV